MNAVVMIEDFQRRGFVLKADGDRIRIAPASALTDKDRAVIREHKPELLVLLTARTTAVIPEPDSTRVLG